MVAKMEDSLRHNEYFQNLHSNEDNNEVTGLLFFQSSEKF